jgi:hypothetical protein
METHLFMFFAVGVLAIDDDGGVLCAAAVRLECDDGGEGD